MELSKTKTKQDKKKTNKRLETDIIMGLHVLSLGLGVFSLLIRFSQPVEIQRWHEWCGPGLVEQIFLFNDWGLLSSILFCLMGCPMGPLLFLFTCDPWGLSFEFKA